ncbi:MAG: S-adenosylmethionine:tRNA ribosyltransferase-isomerase [Cyclobacteriaceae bacterium]
MIALPQPIIQFDLPEHLVCPKPTEDRGVSRDDVRLLVTSGSGLVDHATFKQLDQYLTAGDVLVVNTSATVASALPILLPNRRVGRVHLSNRVKEREWLVEIREVSQNRTMRWKEGEVGMRFPLPGSAELVLKKRYYKNHQWLDLWVAELRSQEPWKEYLQSQAQPIQYEKLDKRYPLEYYQTYFSFHPGSAEMPSAGRGFTGELVEKLLAKGVSLVPILLHTGVSSLEEHEKPYPEYMEISPVSAAILNAAKNQGRRIIAVGTTAVRAVESAVDQAGRVIPFQGNTELYIEAEYPVKVINGLLTGFHEPKASHLHMLQAIAGFDHVQRAYEVAIAAEYYWHQFGNLHLILP